MFHRNEYRIWFSICILCANNNIDNKTIKFCNLARSNPINWIIIYDVPYLSEDLFYCDYFGKFYFKDHIEFNNKIFKFYLRVEILYNIIYLKTISILNYLFDFKLLIKFIYFFILKGKLQLSIWMCQILIQKTNIIFPQ